MISQVSSRIACRYQGSYEDIKGKFSPKSSAMLIQVVVDPATVLLISKMVVDIVSLWKACKKTPEDALLVANNQVATDTERVKEVVRSHLWWWQYWSYGQKIVDAILAEGKEITLEEISMLYQELSNKGLNKGWK